MNNLMLGLRTPNNYGDQPCNIYDASQDMLDDCAGGCGPGGIGDMLVPDRMWFLSVKPACRVHDWMYTWGVTKEDKKLADEVASRRIDIFTKCTKLLIKTPTAGASELIENLKGMATHICNIARIVIDND